jgi:hypothetical protein
MTSPGIPNPDVLDFVNRNLSAVRRAVTQRLQKIGIPKEKIGIVGVPGVEQGAFTRYHRPQGGGNIRPDHPNVLSGLWCCGINVDEAIFDRDFNALAGEQIPVSHEYSRMYQEAWVNASVKTRLDAVAAHEYEEMEASKSDEFQCQYGPAWPHFAALQNAPDTKLVISDEGRELLRLLRRAAGL